MVGVIIIPTGIGCAIGGHAGDATPAARLLAAACDTLIVHPNVVNASDICEMTGNMEYVEGSILDRFLAGEIDLRPVRSNRILMVANTPVTRDTINAADAARVTLGVDIEVLGLDVPLDMVGEFADDGRANGTVNGWRELVDQVTRHGAGRPFDALAIHTPITIPNDVAKAYFRDGGVNPWGGVEAIASRLIATALNKPVAHAPVESATPEDDPDLYFIAREETHPRMAPEVVSTCYAHCILHGLHRAPRIGPGLSADDVAFMVAPIGCNGPAHEACRQQGIPIITVRENTTCLKEPLRGDEIVVENYLEAAGVALAMRAGVSAASVRA
jgi:hypothetical protein